MKKIILHITFLTSTLFCFAQETEPTFNFAQGNVFLEGNLSFVSSKTGDADANTSFTIAPTIGFFTSDKIAFGGSVLIGNTLTDFGDPEDDEMFQTNDFGAAIFGRFYVLEMGKRFKVYTQATGSFLSQKPDENNDDNLKLNTIGADAGIGLQYFVTNKLLINFRLTNLLSFTTSKVSFDGDEDFDIDSTNVFSANLNVFNNFFDTSSFGATYRF